MQAIQELYKAGRGPSSSHTLAPERACRLFTEVNGTFTYYEAELFGSLSLTGRGHRTDTVIQETLPSETKIIFSLDWDEDFPNGFYLSGFDENHVLQKKWTVFSIGGGSIEIKEYPVSYNKEIYKEHSFAVIRKLIEEKNISILDYIYGYEPDLKEYLADILDQMIQCVDHGLHCEGDLPGRLQLQRCAKRLFEETNKDPLIIKNDLRIMSYAYAASEENACGNTCVTAPTLGACGVMSALMYYCATDRRIEKARLIDALAIAGLFGNLIKTNATVSGAVGGCQAEVGAAVSMASAACAFLMEEDIDQIEYAAEIGMEHHLGLTCDPVMGYVMIPCIERNAMGVLRAMDAALLSKHMSGIRKHLVSFDMVVETMNETGKMIPIELKETSEGGLAKEFTHGI